MVALEIGLDIKNADAVLKLADLSTAYDKNGKINKNSLRTAINKVLEEYPILDDSVCRLCYPIYLNINKLNVEN